MNRLFLFCCMFISSYAIATGSMDGITRYGNFDNDNIQSKISCGRDISNKGSSAPTYECGITTKTTTVKWLVINNDDCSYYNINSRVKGEFYVECGIYGKGITYYYKYDERLRNWFLYKMLTEYLPMDGDKPVKDSEIVVPKEQWSIDKTLLKIDKVKDPFALMRIIQNKYNKKQYDEVLAIAKANDIDMSKLSLKTVSDYNNVAFYYQQSGAQVQAISILNTIIDKFPHRDVAYLNLADAYSAINEHDKALSNYQIYIEIMKRNDKANKIPERVLSFVSSD